MLNNLINLDQIIMVFKNFNINLADKNYFDMSNKDVQEQIQEVPLTLFYTLNQEAKLKLL